MRVVKGREFGRVGDQVQGLNAVVTDGEGDRGDGATVESGHQTEESVEGLLADLGAWRYSCGGAEEEMGDLVLAMDGPDWCFGDAAAVADEDDIGCQDREQRVQVRGPASIGELCTTAVWVARSARKRAPPSSMCRRAR
jgi:hypothetical protein